MLVWGLSRRRVLLLIGATILIAIGVIVYTSNQLVMEEARIGRLMSISAIRQNLLLNPGAPCHLPDLPVNSSVLADFFKEVPPIQCTKGGRDWVHCTGHTCQVKGDILRGMKWVSCWYRDILWSTDHATTLSSDTVVRHNASQYTLRASDFAEVECSGERLYGTKEKWSGYVFGIRDSDAIKKATTWEKMSGEAMRYNVLMFGFDSLSRNTFIRKLPKSYGVLANEFKAHILEGYNIVGDGTPQALIPILTGFTELELPDTRKRMGDKAQYVDVYPFVWDHFANNGYVTSFNEDTPSAGIFTYRLKGFKSQPTHHYLRPYYLHTEHKASTWSPYCNGDTPRHKVMLDYTKQLMETYSDKPRFVFSFHGELSHDNYNLIQAADDDLVEFLHHLRDSGILKNTILIIMSDHGHRFAAIRNTLQGKQEERLPWFSITLPPDMGLTHQGAIHHLTHNTRRLTTPFDIHPTLLEVLGIKDSENYDLRSRYPPRALTLFGPISENRTCGQASIEPHWCACLSWTSISTTSSLAKKLADRLVLAINNYVSPFGDMCAELVLDKIEWVMTLSATDGIIGFKFSVDKDGFIPDLSARTNQLTKLYQIKVRLIPGNSLFEASLTHKLEDDSITVKLSDISRINKYGDQARCVYDSNPQLRKYCYCTRD